MPEFISPWVSGMERDPGVLLIQLSLFPDTAWSTGEAGSPPKEPKWAPAEKCHGFY